MFTKVDERGMKDDERQEKIAKAHERMKQRAHDRKNKR